jgi:hypothetical protein
MAAWAQWVWSPTLTDVESAQHSQRAVRSSPHTGSELSGGEIARRMLTGSHNGDLEWRYKFIVICFSTFSIWIVMTPILLCQPRCTWVIALPDSTRRLCLATKIFSSKRRKLSYLILQIAVSTYLNVWVLLSWGEDFYFWKKIKLLKKILFKEKNIFERKYFYLSQDKSSELSHVERTPTCIVSLMLRFVVRQQKP